MKSWAIRFSGTRLLVVGVCVALVLMLVVADLYH